MKQQRSRFVFLLRFAGMLAAFSLFLQACSPSGEENWVRVERVVDGDTFVIEGGERVRLIGVDTPESVKPNHPVEPYGKEAKAFTKRMLEGKRVRLEFDVAERDRYGRLLAYVYLEDGTFYNLLLVEEGYGKVLTVPPNVEHAEEFVEAERRARQEEKGLWSVAQREEQEKERREMKGEGGRR
ncbi:thermonuclease family protein [Bacillaceae bacterium]